LPALPLVAYANRLPVQKIRGHWQASAGGLVAALRPALETRDSGWVGWDGGAEDMPRRVDGLDIELASVSLSRREVAGYYHGFSNSTLWPLLHGAIEQPVFDLGWWQTYAAVNERFAAAETGRRAMRWVHDYQLMLVPELLRAYGARGPTLVAQILKISSAYSPPPPEGFVSPMTWGVEENVIERFTAAGVSAEQISFERDTYTFEFPAPPSELVAQFRDYYGPTMNAFDAAAADGREDELKAELDDLFASKNTSTTKNVTSIPATFLRVTVAV
jgi:Glycosyltransferase family 20